MTSRPRLNLKRINCCRSHLLLGASVTETLTMSFFGKLCNVICHNHQLSFTYIYILHQHTRTITLETKVDFDNSGSLDFRCRRCTIHLCLAHDLKQSCIAYYICACWCFCTTSACSHCTDTFTFGVIEDRVY